MDDSLLEQARAWAAEDPDRTTRTELERVMDAVDAGDEAALVDLADRFDGTLEFGTAGLRGALGAGPHRMNRVVVIRAAAGLAAYLKSRGATDEDAVVIGYDARHNSDVFARDTAEVMTGAGLRAYLLPGQLPTPVLAYAIRRLGCVAGVMVTASHNPPQDNGYKVYLGDGSQIVPPADTDIAERISRVGALDDVPRGHAGEQLDNTVLNDYLESVATVVSPQSEARRKDLKLVYTPLHGVGNSTVLRVLDDAGFARPSVVPEQQDPDPEFSTVAFPNPEEPGAMDLAMALASEVDADLVLANDPDADRCAAAIPTPQGWRMLRGDEIGALLGDHLLRAGKVGVYAASIVSSSLLGKLAAEAGEEYVGTLTGFKWIGRIDRLAFGYEEALGYCVDPANVKDKDGVSALLLLCEIAAKAKTEGRTLTDLLDDIAVRHGLHATDQVSARVTDLAQLGAAMKRLREDPPTELGGLTVHQAEDLSEGSEDLPPTDGLRYRLADGARVIVRPSGTEPKIKCYLEVVVPVEEHPSGSVREAVDAARISAAGRLDALRIDIKAAAGI